MARDRLPHARVSRLRRLPVARRGVSHASLSEGRHIPGRCRPDPVSRQPGRNRHPAAADSGVPGRLQPWLQRNRLLLSRNGLRRRRCRSRTVCRAGQRAAHRQGPGAVPPRRSPRRDEPAEGAGRSLPRVRHGGDLRPRVQPRRRRLRRSDAVVLRSPEWHRGAEVVELLVLLGQDLGRRCRLQLSVRSGSRVSHRQRQVPAGRIPRRRVSLRRGQRHRPQQLRARMGFLPGADRGRCAPIARARCCTRNTGTSIPGS